MAKSPSFSSSRSALISCSKQPQSKHEASELQAASKANSLSRRRRRWPVVNGGERLRQYPIQRTRPNQHGNVANLKEAWSFSTGATNGHEAAPLVVGDTMYVVTPFPNMLYALDLKNGGTLKWRYDPKPLRRKGRRVLRCRESRSCLLERPDLLQHARCPHGRGGRATGKEVWKTEARRVHQRRDDHDGAGRREEQGTRRQLAAARWECAAG